MIASLLKDASTTEEKALVLSRILQDQHLHPLIPEKEKLLMIEFTFHLLQTQDTYKVIGYQLTSLLLLHSMLPLSGIHTVLDRLIYHIEHIHSHDESNALSQLISRIFQHSSEDIQVKVSPMLPKLISTCLKLTHNDHTRIYGFELIQELIQFRNIPSQNLFYIRNICLDHLDQPTYHPSITHIFAYSYWHATYDEWSSSWSLLSSYIQQCLHHLGLTKTLNSSEQTFHSSLNQKIRSKSGASKTVLLQRILHGLFQMQINMLNTGNPNFFVSMDISPLMDIISVLLPYSIEATAHNLESTMITENQSHVSPAAILLILPDVKVDCVQLIHAIILNYQHACVSCVPTMLRYLSIGLSLHQAKHPRLTDQILHTLTLVISTFPSLISQVGHLRIISIAILMR